MSRLNKSDWFAEGLRILSEFAQDKIKILYLCERLGVTRGSFYHHFVSIDEFIEALMSHWSETNTQGFIDAADKGAGPVERITILNEMVIQADTSVEAAIRSWSYYNDIVRRKLMAVDRVRMDYLQQIFLDMGMDESTASSLASIEYALLVGVQQLFPNASKEELYALYQVHQQFWSPPGSTPPND